MTKTKRHLTIYMEDGSAYRSEPYNADNFWMLVLAAVSDKKVRRFSIGNDEVRVPIRVEMPARIIDRPDGLLFEFVAGVIGITFTLGLVMIAYGVYRWVR